jgi:DNA-binding HxlR family transcriptional regulator
VKQYYTPVEATLDIIGGKWKVVILCHLTKGKKRTSELLRLIPDISTRILTKQLRELEKDGVIVRKVYDQIPPRVEYSLTEYGMSLQHVLHSLTAWGEQCIDRQRNRSDK